ncbi:MAG: ABC-F family ATP-binding cassette domain-containing protein [Proteobacteria bacterium]|nr:ABC-F family ATP-binding cassette domain-containing protein [Pseudomonadota bacterium]
MAPPVLVQAKGLRLSLGSAPLFEDAEFSLHKGERAALVGANGAGKSTLLSMLAGLATPDDGAIAFASGASVALAQQEPDLSAFATLRDFAMSPSTPRDHGGAPAHAAEAALETFGLDPDRPTIGLSGGEVRRASLARALAADADVLLLDEPTNHLDIIAIEALETIIAKGRGASLIISHDRRFLERVSTATLWLRQRRLYKLARGFSAFEDWAEAIEREEAYTLARLETQLKAEEHWLRRGVTARRSRNQGRRRRLIAMRAERRERQSMANSQAAAIQAARGAESARRVIDAKDICKRYGDRALIKDFSLRVMRGDRVGIVGANGAGKTTLLEILLKRREPDSGEVRLGENLEIAYVDQIRAILDPNKTLWEALVPQGGDQVMVRGAPRHVAAYAGEFLFTPTQLRQPVSALSGGERNRLALAVALAKPANLLVLDEPTNDLDMETLDALEDMLAAYDGTVLIVSHDRAFLDGVATQVVAPLGNGKWVESPGGWADFERAFPDAITPPTPTSAPIPRPQPRDREPARITKLSFKQERRVAELAALMPRLHDEITALEHSLTDGAAFERDPKAFETAAARLAAARAEHDVAETEWLEIELLREHLAGQT